MRSETTLHRRTRLAAAAAAAGVALVAAGCGSSSNSGGAASSATSASAGATATSGGATATSGGGSTGSGTSSTAASTGGSSATGKKVSVGYILAAPVSALEAIGDGVKKQSARLGMSFQQVSANFNPDQQLAAMQAMEAKHVDVIISAPLNPDSFFQAAQQASKKGIKVLTYNKAGSGVTYAVTNPDTQEATNIVGVLAKHLKAIGKPCDIGIIEGQPTAPPLLARNTGFMAGAKANGCTVLASQVATETTPAQGSAIANSWKTRFGSKMTGMVVINDDTAVGTLPARTGDFQPAVVSMNGEPAAVKAVQNGSMYADGGLENAVMGLSLAQVAYDVTHGKKVPPTAESPYFLITKQTADTFNRTFADATVLKGDGTTSFSGSGAHTILKYKP